jgi:hypothetical protein
VSSLNPPQRERTIENIERLSNLTGSWNILVAFFLSSTDDPDIASGNASSLSAFIELQNM